MVAKYEVVLVEVEGSVGAGQAAHGSVLDELELEMELEVDVGVGVGHEPAAAVEIEPARRKSDATLLMPRILSA
jgi:hypothetical protein